MARLDPYALPKRLRERVDASVIPDASPYRFRVYWNRHAGRLDGSEVADILARDLIERAVKCGAEAFRVDTHVHAVNFRSYYLIEITDPTAKVIEDIAKERGEWMAENPVAWHPLNRTLGRRPR